MMSYYSSFESLFIPYRLLFIDEAPLIVASIRGDTETAEALLEDGAPVNLESRLWSKTALMMASENGHTSTVKALLKAGAKTDILTDEYAKTALMMASKNGHTSTVEALLKAGAQTDLTDKYCETALMMASWKGHTSTVKALLKAGAQTDLTDMWGKTALMMASKNGHTSTVEALLKAGAQTDLIYLAPCRTALFMSARDQCGETAFMMASENGHTSTVEALLKAGAKTDLTDMCGETALIKASRNGHIRTVEALLRAVRQSNLTKQFPVSSLERASKNGHTNTVEVLLKAINEASWQEMLFEDFVFQRVLSSCGVSLSCNENIFCQPFHLIFLTKSAAIALLWCTSSLKEVIGAGRGSAPPLDFVVRFINSKFWVMESDVWADLLIICRWANPTTTISNCPGCGNEITITSATGSISATVHCETPGCGHTINISISVATNTGTKRVREAADAVDDQPPSAKRRCSPRAAKAVAGAPVKSVAPFQPKDLAQLIESLIDACPRWYRFGLQLGLTSSELEAIRKNTQDSEDCLLKVLDKRLKLKPLPRHEIVQALKANSVGLGHLAINL